MTSRTGKSDAHYIAELEQELFNKENPVKEVFNKENSVKEVFNNEPVAWIYERPDGSAKLVWVREPHDKSIIKEIPLYTAPQTKPFTERD
jgi:hypothetical protein